MGISAPLVTALTRRFEEFDVRRYTDSDLVDRIDWGESAARTMESWVTVVEKAGRLEKHLESLIAANPAAARDVWDGFAKLRAATYYVLCAQEDQQVGRELTRALEHRLLSARLHVVEDLEDLHQGDDDRLDAILAECQWVLVVLGSLSSPPERLPLPAGPQLAWLVLDGARPETGHVVTGEERAPHAALKPVRDAVRQVRRLHDDDPTYDIDPPPRPWGRWVAAAAAATLLLVLAGGAAVARFDCDGDGYTVRRGRCVPGLGDGAGVDCDDGDPTVPTEEVCDRIDNDCDGAADEDLPFAEGLWADPDGDAYGDGAPLQVCSAEVAEVRVAKQDGDCAPGDPERHPGATERCDNELDDDCDDETDEGCDTIVVPQPRCVPRAEVPNARDDDCDGHVDEIRAVLSPCPEGREPWPNAASVGVRCLNDGCALSTDRYDGVRAKEHEVPLSEPYVALDDGVKQVVLELSGTGCCVCWGTGTHGLMQVCQCP